MSIAASVIVRPSRGLRWLHAGLCLCVLLSSAACPGLLAPLACVLAAALGYGCGVARGPCSGIAMAVDITADGHFCAAVYQHSGQARAIPLRLLDGSVVWRGLLLLRLGGAGGSVRSVLVLPDCVSEAALRALMLAGRAAAARSEINTPTQ